jgi:RimJ/RimL family protein N-acetyltransferase
VHIEHWSEHDLPLLERLLGDPAMMAHLGGPETPEQIAQRHARYLAGADRDPQFRIVADGAAVGWVGYWERGWRDADVYETGWSVLPEHQGRGLAAGATALALDHARAGGRRRYVHAFPSVGNAASNAICRKLGFTLLEECDFEFPPGATMRCNDWRFDLRA